MTTNLSPAAQAVLDAFNEVHELVNRRRKIAAALHAVANDWRIDTESIGGVEYIRTSTLDKIADELKAPQ